MRLVGSNRAARAEGLEPLSAKSHYLRGNDSGRWFTKVPHYGRVLYREVYRGIDLVYYRTPEGLEFDFVVAPASSPRAIRLAFEGVDRLEADGSGGLALRTAAGEARLPEPTLYQEVGGKRVSVPGAYVLQQGSEVRVEVGRYDARRPLVIDPIITFSSFLGGTGSEETSDEAGVAADANGHVYLASRTTSPDFPVVNPAQATLGGGTDAFVAKVDPETASLIYATYLGGSGADNARSVRVDPAGNAYVAGETTSFDFPTVHPFQPSFGGSQDAFVAKLDPTGSAFFYSTYLGGTGGDGALDIGIDSLGNALVTGLTSSVDFPTMAPVQPAIGGAIDAFVAKLNPTGASLVYSTYLGGDDNDIATAIASDESGSAYITGVTASDNFPTVNAFQPSFGGTGSFGFGDAFISKLTADGSALTYSTYLGGSADESGQSIDVDALGNAHASGATSSSNFPAVNALQGSFAGGFFDGFVVKLGVSGSTAVYSTYLGGSGTEFAHGIAVDGFGNAYLSGHTDSTDFPVVNAFQGAKSGGTDGFVSKLDAIGSRLVYSSFLGGQSEDRALAIAINSPREVYLMGDTQSANFPTVNPFQGALGGPFDVFVTKLEEPGPEVAVRLDDVGGQITLRLELSNADSQPATVELKLWIDSAILGSPVSIAGVPSVTLTLPALQPPVEVVSLSLPAALPFPGTTVGARLYHPVTGNLLSEALCMTRTCPVP
jgi:hypothetical protein